ncbi:DEAD/DEAH box helicase [Bradymonas sediminis]|uniref:DEAD/DEAH-box helicase domain-containing protein n=1 Tax=Bradymonas sediminis TaxID=1548548 RepID=A0A2Z4FL71_9DELT|nr:DEAD/DEAH box helicase [Bradymonas sediminis]AWV89751.1 hypothetical protein DN745_10540 [Bradymonas sediminis]TDP76502.1 ATP-dependent helicase YprA (DUF1998 family) [Bradymonas sediminis]
MNDLPGGNGFIAGLVLLIRMFIAQMWRWLAEAFDLAQHIGPMGAALVILGVCALAFSIAFAMQRRINRALIANPSDTVSIPMQELAFLLPVVVVYVLIYPILLIIRAIRAAINAIGALFASKDDAKEKEEKAEAKEPPSVIVASIGPSFLWAGLIVAALFGLAWLTEPLLRYQLGLGEGAPAWQYLLLGSRPEMQWYMPLQRFPYLNLLSSAALWFGVWWWTARIIRVVYGSELGANLASRIHNNHLLASWRTWFGASKLFKADDSYRSWASWLLVAAVPFLAWGLGTIAGDPYRMHSSFFSISVILWVSWAIHLSLSGHWYLSEPKVEAPPEVEPDPGKGWPDVLADLKTRLLVEEPYTFEAPRVVQPIEAAARPADRGLISDLLEEIYPSHSDNPDAQKIGLTHMQQSVLETLSRQAYVHLDPPPKAASLELGRVSGAGIEDESGQRHRNQVILAPDGSGKTTLAMLAAFNHALTHTRSTLVVTRDEESAERFSELLRATLEPSTLRWTLRVKAANSSLISDLSQGIIPDVIVTSLRQLVVSILDEPQLFAPFLKTLGLIIIDDAESFCGPVEVHMQLAFRRLTLRVRELLGTNQLGEESAPVTLILGTDSMHNTAAWLKSLCGIDAVTRTFDYSDDGYGDASSATGTEALEDAEPGRYHLFYQLSDFSTQTGDGVSVADLIASCERLGIAWHYHRCGDAMRRHGRRQLKLGQEPQYDVESPLDACVVFLEGHISTVRREIRHLSRAGLRYLPAEGETELAGPVPIALISVVDSDERMALTELNPNSSLAEIVRTLPRPVVRAPFGQAVEAHLASDLVDTWLEVADILDVFGNTAVHTLSRLAESGLLLHESRTDLDEAHNEYETNLHVRVPLKAVASGKEHDPSSVAHLLPPRVAQVERPPGPSVAVRDRTNLTVLEETDKISARHLYYPGRIFESAKGRYVVVSRAAEESRQQRKTSPVSAHDILVEPFLNDEISSPRRRTYVRPMRSSDMLPGAVAPLRANAKSGENNVDAEPLFIGDFPLAVSLGAVECRTQHRATFRLDAHHYEVRQRILFDDIEPETLRTVALGIYPNPALEIVSSPDCPRLQLRDARLIAAAMRALLPSIYRGADSDIQVALHIADPDAPPEHALGPDEGFYLYDPHLGGNGTAHAIHRDGVELLLRFCRVYLERVLYHDRLRARYDFWADEDELHGRRRVGQARSRDDIYYEDLSERDRDQFARKRALSWLDSRLRPEGSSTGGKRRAQFGVGSEEGEGDIFDLGRCWFSADGSVTDLIWTRHRWMLDSPREVGASEDSPRAQMSEEAMCDVGIGREIAARARIYDADTPQLSEQLNWITKQLQNPAFMLEDQSIWGTPCTVWEADGDSDAATGSDAALLKLPATLAFQKLANAIVCDNYEMLAPLAELLAERSGFRSAEPGRDGVLGGGGLGGDEERRRFEMARFLADFVQGIPFVPEDDPETIFGPVHTLLYRLGNQESQSLLLAILLRHVGIDAGLFLHPESDSICCGAALPADPSAEGIARWRAEFGDPEQSLIWAELAPQPGATGGVERAFVPIVTDSQTPLASIEALGLSSDGQGKWVFLPLSAAWLRLGVEKREIKEER